MFEHVYANEINDWSTSTSRARAVLRARVRSLNRQTVSWVQIIIAKQREIDLFYGRG